MRLATDTLTASEVDLDRLAVDTARVLAMDAIQKAGSGHPGTAMALARPPMCCGPGSCGSVPVDPEWFDRDWFVLSAGHAWCCRMRRSGRFTLTPARSSTPSTSEEPATTACSVDEQPAHR